MGVDGLLGSIKKIKPTVDNAVRTAFPGIYGNPAEIAAKAASNTAPESQNLFDLFGATRRDLYNLNKGKVGNEAPDVKLAANPKGSAAADGVMTRSNANRLVNIMQEAQKYPDLAEGMIGWYEMQPVYDRLAQISDDPVSDFKRFQSMTGMASPMSDVITELRRGTHALYGANTGRFEDFFKYGGGAPGGPEWLRGNPGTMGHSTSQAPSMQRYLQSGLLDSEDPKVRTYVHSAGVPETGFQTILPVGDGHYSRGVGLSDTRTNKDFDKSISRSELQALAPWWKRVSIRAGDLNPVNGQGLLWGTLGHATGVKTPVGAPKAEILADEIAKTAQIFGTDPAFVRDQVLLGKLPLVNPNFVDRLNLEDYLKIK